MIPAYLLLLLPGDVLGLAGAGSVAPVGVDGQVCGEIGVSLTVRGFVSVGPSVVGRIEIKPSVSGRVGIAECC